MSQNTDYLYFSEKSDYLISQHYSVYNALAGRSDIIEEHGKYFCFNVTGLMIIDERIVTVFPKGYSISDKPVTDVSILLRVLLRYRNSRNLEQEEIRMLYGDQAFKSGRLAAAIALLDDYQSNGFIRRLNMNRSYKANGFIDWNRTIKTSPCIISNRRPLYLTPDVRSTYSDPNNIICKIHKAVITECIEMFGLLCGISTNINEFFPMPISPSEAVSILKIELGNTYSQRDIEILKLLIQYLSAKSGADSNQDLELLVTPFFHNTWEAICGYLFENQYNNLKSIVPKPKWKNAIVSNSISQRPDILFIHNNTLFILDAKYYDYNSTLPGWHDVVKQLFYKFTIERYKENNKAANSTLANVIDIKNVFVLPENGPKDLLYLGDIYVNDVSELGDINVYAINLKKAMMLYAYKSKSNYRNELEMDILSLGKK